jgi:hypothetical protein
MVVHMGRRGPVGKHPDWRLGHRTEAEKSAVVRVPCGPPRVPVPKVDPQWHPIARDWFRSLAKSGQATLYEPSDWQTARYVAEAMSRNLSIGRFNAALLATVLSGMSSLLATEGDRRRVGVQLIRAGAQDADGKAADAAVLDFQARLAARTDPVA